jgi:hypothetical protein
MPIDGRGGDHEVPAFPDGRVGRRHDVFAATVAMHEASRAYGVSQTVTPVAMKLVELAELLRPAQ